MNILLENLNTLFTKKNTTISEFSSTTGISRVTLTKIFSKYDTDTDISLNTCLTIAKELNIDFPSTLVRSNLDKSYSEEEYLNIFITNVKQILNRTHTVQKKLSTLPGISESTISDLLSGKTKNPNISTLYHISNILNKSIYQLFQERGV
ncbi:helix-turn-helix transcriptional regulator [Vagococcus fluvialis]|uniref:helix-turn-helix domain-containing protein n=1 Tax=Vagococcus fluvialis TaxID=2738 RepID=UPI0014333D01|nr:helix-turn-helix domain-containing protein [Vagococcus fluvialis]NKC60591.1 helix-turn-helix transcriptional regulator [Vagococcus fluvialis]NKD51425.1 helix-turn-helix transcriptional regulator [Vagococcus fluvialis]